MTTSSNPARTYFGDQISIDLPSPYERRNRRGDSPVEYKVSYINNLPHDVVIGWRCGLKFTVPSTADFNSTSFIVRLEITIRQDAVKELETQLSFIDANSPKELQQLREAFVRRTQENIYWGATLVLDYPITKETLTEYGGSVYFHELDQVFSLLPYDAVPDHPYSEQGRLARMAVVGPSDTASKDFFYSMEVVDNLGKFGDRFLNLNGEIYRLHPRKSNIRRDGVYLFYGNRVINNILEPERNYRFFDLSIADEALGLYKTYTEALNHGNHAKNHETQMKETELQTQRMKVELQNQRQKFDIQLLNAEKENRRLQAEFEERERISKAAIAELEQRHAAERTRVKDYWEDRSHQRKDQSEALKFIPALIVGIGATLLAIKKWF
jgi:hypothetical protein